MQEHMPFYIHDVHANGIKCCGADKRVDPAIDLSLMRASSDSQR